jgi:uridine kinase
MRWAGSGGLVDCGPVDEEAQEGTSAGGLDRDRRRVVVLAGPSGSGKSRLADRLHDVHGWPVFRLYDFYRDGDDPAVPRHPVLGIVDWDHPDSWDAGRALTALGELLDTGRTRMPVYDISASRAVGHHEVAATPEDLVLAEGIFAAEIVARLATAGMLHSAWCVHHRPSVTFVRRLLRDLRERRKPPGVLVRRGWALMRDEPGIVARQTALGARPARATVVERALAADRARR